METIRNLKIGCDVDQVVADYQPNLLKHFNNRFKTCFKPEDITIYNYLEIVELENPEERQAFLNQAYEDEKLLFQTTEPIPGSANFLNRLVAEGYDVHYITARGHNLLLGTLHWLLEYGFPVTERSIHTRDYRGPGTVQFKVDKSRELGLSIFVEDNGENALDLAEQLSIPVILFDYPWNRTLNHPLIHRVKGQDQYWEQAYTIIKKLTAEKRPLTASLPNSFL